jgi:hypothetical protein
MKSVTRCQYTGSGILAHAQDEKGVERRIALADVRAGVVFPTGALPGYYVLFGRKWTSLPAGKRPLMFLTEGQELVHEALFTKLSDACTKFKCRTIYADKPTANRVGGIGGFDDLWRYLRNRKLQINLIPAPAADDVEYGMALLREYWTERALDLPPTDLTPTILRGQLKTLPGLKQPGKDDGAIDEKRLYAFHAMRFLLAGFVKFNNVIAYGVQARKDPRASSKGWT